MNTSDATVTTSLESKLMRLERVEREDVVMFVNTCFAATNQTEYYTDGFSESVSVSFLHEYMLFNYRTVYARCLAVGINHFNQAHIMINLLAVGAPVDITRRSEEGALIAKALQRLPANRAFAVLMQLSRRKINNRRARAVAKSYLQGRREPEFDAVKYRRYYRSIVRHAHAKISEDCFQFLFNFKQQKEFKTPLFETVRQAHYTQAAIYKLPYSIAESFAKRHNISRAEFLRKIEPKLTRHERLRLQNAAAKASGKPVNIELDASGVSLTKLTIYCLSLPWQQRQERATELHELLQAAAVRAVRSNSMKFKRVAAVLDCSRSSAGSRAKASRPLAIAVATWYLLQAASEEFHGFWTWQESDEAEASVEGSNVPVENYPFLRQARGQTGLASPVIDALEVLPNLLVIVSDGWENDPPQAVSGIVQAARNKIPGVKAINIVHANPVFDPEHFSPRPLSPSIATVGLRDAEDLATMIEFAAFASGKQELDALEAYLLQRSHRFQGLL